MVTRTTKFTEVTVMTVNKQTAEVENRVISLPKTFKKDKALHTAIQEALSKESADLKFVDVVDKTEVEKLLGMKDDEFSLYAVELDPKTRKPLGEQEESEE